MPRKQEMKSTNEPDEGFEKLLCYPSSGVQHTAERVSRLQTAKAPHPQSAGLRHIIVSVGCERSSCSSWHKETLVLFWWNVRFQRWLQLRTGEVPRVTHLSTS